MLRGEKTTMKISSDEIIETYRFCGGGEDCASDCPYHHLRDVDECGPYWSGSCEECTCALESDYEDVCDKATYYGKCKTCQFYITHIISIDKGECYFNCIHDGKINWNEDGISKRGSQTCKNYVQYQWDGWDEYT
jgi:hypothetical protein